MPTSPRSLVCRCIWLISALSFAACTRVPSPELNPNPLHGISIIGTVPTEVEIKLTAVWQTTVLNDACAPKMRWPVGVRFPKVAGFPVPLKDRSGNETVWETWWDLLAPGECGWRLAALEFKADRSPAQFSAHAANIVASRIASVCIGACIANTPRANDDPLQAVTQYCRFSVLGKDEMGRNPCVYGSDGRFAGPDATPFKEQHILQPGQQLVRFLLVDLDSSRR
jgi:hypothetical protein